MRNHGLALLATLAGGCDCAGYRLADSDASADATTDATTDAMNEIDASEPGCDACATGGLAGVELCVASDRCTYAVGEGGTFDVRVTVDRTEPIHTASAWGGELDCSECFRADENPVTHLSFVVWSDPVAYCPSCDLGCCAPFPRTELTLVQGVQETSFEWPGRQWGGPSDTPSPLGDPFPPGDYVVRVTFHTTEEGGVTVELPIAVVDR